MIVKSYLKFLWNSKNEYSVHSPFVFDLVTQCFYDGKSYAAYETLKSYREALLQNKNTIEVIDYGAGSKVFKSNKRRISKIAKAAGITPRRGELLFRVVNYFKPSGILEIGTSLGLATAALSLGNKAAKVTTLEGCPGTSKVAQQQFKKFGLTNINPVVAEFESYLSNYPLSIVNYQLIYFDGNHQKAATLQYFDLLLPTITDDSVWIFDDIHWSADMEKAWETIKENPHVTVTIDTFQWGFVFFRKGQHKQHFVIRG